MPLPKDESLYEKIKKEIYTKYPKHSAYRSGLLVMKYKEEEGYIISNSISLFSLVCMCAVLCVLCIIMY